MSKTLLIVVIVIKIYLILITFLHAYFCIIKNIDNQYITVLYGNKLILEKKRPLSYYIIVLLLCRM